LLSIELIDFNAASVLKIKLEALYSRLPDFCWHCDLLRSVLQKDIINLRLAKTFIFSSGRSYFKNVT